MTQEKTIARPSGQETQMVQVHGDPSTGGPSPLLQQVAEYGHVARQARADCQRGAEAEQELAKRRNRSGQ